MTDEQTQKLTRLFLKIIAGIVFTDLEALPDGCCDLLSNYWLASATNIRALFAPLCASVVICFQIIG